MEVSAESGESNDREAAEEAERLAGRLPRHPRSPSRAESVNEPVKQNEWKELLYMVHA